jgi:hypothetical protein
MVALSACAHIVKPTGGPRDSKGPEVIGAIPPPRVLNYFGDEVVIYFDEFIKPGVYNKEVFVSPVQLIEPTITVKNKRITIHFNTPLRDSTTYVVTFGTGIKDFNEGNKMEKPFTYAFSTGNQLDTLQIAGRVVFPWDGKGEGAMKVIAYLADDVEGNDIFDKRPVYATETDKDGYFTIEYLREAAYKVYAVRDDDNNYMYSNKRERVGITANPLVNLSDSAERRRDLVLYSYTEDKEAPTVKNVRWSNEYSIQAEFGEQIRPRFDSLGLKMTVIDSVSGEEQEVKVYRFPYESTASVVMQSPFPRDRTLSVRFEYLMDSLGTYTDTTLTLVKEQIIKPEQQRLFDPPVVEGGSNLMQVLSYFPLPAGLDTSLVSVLDSSGKKLKLEITVEDYLLRIKPDTVGIKAGLPYTLVLDSAIALPDGKSPDSTLRFVFAFTNPADYGSLAGEIVPDTLHPGTQYVMLLTLPAQKKGSAQTKRVTGPGKFSFKYLPAGKYSIRLIKDDDKNGYLSPGSLNPYFLPEKVIIDPNPVEVKANWAVEGYNVFPYEAPKKSSKLAGAKGAKDNVETPDDQDVDKDED